MTFFQLICTVERIICTDNALIKFNLPEFVAREKVQGNHVTTSLPFRKLKTVTEAAFETSYEETKEYLDNSIRFWKMI